MAPLAIAHRGNPYAFRENTLDALAPRARIALTWTGPEPPAETLLRELGVEYLNPRPELVEAGLVDAMHARGVSVSTRTVDAPAEMARLLDLGVDAVITNRIGGWCPFSPGAPLGTP